MTKKIIFALCISLLGASCGSEIRQLKETEYLRTQTGKPVVYPESLDQPAQEKTFVIPELPKGAQASQAPELLALPPRLAGVDLSEDPEDEKKSEDKDEGDRPVDDGFLETR